jgi:hypothetical protein
MYILINFLIFCEINTSASVLSSTGTANDVPAVTNQAGNKIITQSFRVSEAMYIQHFW